LTGHSTVLYIQYDTGKQQGSRGVTRDLALAVGRLFFLSRKGCEFSPDSLMYSSMV